MNKTKTIVKIVILVALFVLLANPRWLPFLDSGTQEAITAELQNAFGVFLGSSSGNLAPAKIVSALAAGVLVWLLTIVACLILDQVSKGKNRTKTVAELIRSLVSIVGAIAGIVWVLSILGVNLGAIFASLGIASLIIGFGVQSLLEDCVTGIFIIMEGNYNIGDIIVLDDFRGTVKKISMRTTTMEDGGGNLKIVNNSDIRNIQNRSNSQSVAVADIGISYNEDIRKVEKILKEALPFIFERNMDVFEAVPNYAGVQMLADSAVILRVSVAVQEANYFAASRRLNRDLKILFDERGIEIPFNQIVVHNAK